MSPWKKQIPFLISIAMCLGFSLLSCRNSSTELNIPEVYPEIIDSDDSKQTKLDNLKKAQDDYESDPDNLENIIWYGRRLAYLYKYDEAIEVFSKGIQIHPESPELYRHRGHRKITLRDFDGAIQDFEKAAVLVREKPIQVEPDGIPNRLNIPLSSLQFNVYYHLGLAHYLKGDFMSAIESYKECMKYSTNPDLLCATLDWLYMTHRRLGHESIAEKVLNTVNNEWNVIENESYFNRLRMYKGEIMPKDLLDLENADQDAQIDIVTQGYGVGNWFLYNGDEKRAIKIFNRIMDCDYWPAFGYIAAEADLRRMGDKN